MKKRVKLSFDTANKYFRYDPETGKLLWKISRTNKVKIGQEAGGFDKDGYRVVNVSRRYYKTHRIIWLLITGKMPGETIDHIDGNCSNNRFENLRSVPEKINLKNMSIRKTNTSGHTGVYWCKGRNKWMAYIRVNGKMKPLGRYKTIEEAIKVRQYAERKYGFHPNHGKRKPHQFTRPKDKLISTTNNSGCVGVCWSKDKKKWHVRAKVNKKHYQIGYFSSKKMAIAARYKFEKSKTLH